MGNIIVVVGLLVLFGWIIHSMIKNYKTKGTTCTSCTACPIVSNCDADRVKSDLRTQYYSQK